MHSPVVALMVLLLAAARLAAQGASIMGPYIMTYVHPKDEPWGVFPYGY